MSERTGVSWCDSTHNEWIGCKPVSPGCLNCYARESTPARVARDNGVELWGAGKTRQRTSEANRRKPYAWNKRPWVCDFCGRSYDAQFIQFDEPCQCHQSMKAQPSNSHYHRRRVFCGSLMDWLDPEVPTEWLARLLQTIHGTPNINYLMLSKRLELWRERMAACGPYYTNAFPVDWIHEGIAPPNVIPGASIENQEMADKRIPELLAIPAVKRFLSVEPMLGPVRFTTVCGLSFNRNPDHTLARKDGTGIDWVIIGGESGPKRRPFQIEWLEDAVAQCDAAGVAVFVKQDSALKPGQQGRIPDKLWARKEFPRA